MREKDAWLSCAGLAGMSSGSRLPWFGLRLCLRGRAIDWRDGIRTAEFPSSCSQPKSERASRGRRRRDVSYEEDDSRKPTIC